MGWRDRIVLIQWLFSISNKIPRFSGFNSGICGINVHDQRRPFCCKTSSNMRLLRHSVYKQQFFKTLSSHITSHLTQSKRRVMKCRQQQTYQAESTSTQHLLTGDTNRRASLNRPFKTLLTKTSNLTFVIFLWSSSRVVLWSYPLKM